MHAVRTRPYPGRVSFALLAAAALYASFAAAPPAVARPALQPLAGPGNVLAVHLDVLRALDSGDQNELTKSFSANAQLLLVDEERGEPLAISSIDGLGSAFTHKSTQGASLGWESRIVDSTTECPSGRLASGTIVFERRRTVAGNPYVRRYRSTALLKHDGGRLRIFYWHVSPAAPFAPFNELVGADR